MKDSSIQSLIDPGAPGSNLIQLSKGDSILILEPRKWRPRQIQKPTQAQHLAKEVGFQVSSLQWQIKALPSLRLVSASAFSGG